jgi:CDGSH-type Zn-finger protein
MSNVEIRTYDNGPLLVTGEIVLTDGAGGHFSVENSTIALCRCGHSNNKPFCDGSHSREGFESQCRADR